MEQIYFEKPISDLSKFPLETETIEFKENHFNKDEIGKRISAISNSANLTDQKCGYLVFGINDKTHKIVGTKFSAKTEKVGNDELEFWLTRHLDPRIDFEIYEGYFDNKAICLFVIPPATNLPVKFNNIPYIRVGSTTPKLTDYPDKERNIWNNINRKSFEKGLAKEHLRVSEVLDLLDYAKYFSLTKQEIPSETSQFVEKMAQHSLVKKVFTDSYDITNLGAILFAKRLFDFPSVKRKSVRVIQYQGNTKVNHIKEY